MKKKIIMLRHAESIGNAGGATIDSASMGLSELGIAQAQELPTAIGVVPEILIYSKYLRAEQTADPLRRTHPHSVCSVWEIHEFTYLNGMKYKNTTQKQRQFPRQEYWSRCDPMYCDEGGAESFYDFLRRVDVYIRRLQTIYYDPIVVISHELFILGTMFLLENKIIPSAVTREHMEVFRSMYYTKKIANTALYDLSEQILAY